MKGGVGDDGGARLWGVVLRGMEAWGNTEVMGE